MWLLVVTQASDSTDSGCSKTMDPNIVLGNSLSLGVTTALVGVADCPDQHGPNSSVAFKHFL